MSTRNSLRVEKVQSCRWESHMSMSGGQLCVVLSRRSLSNSTLVKSEVVLVATFQSVRNCYVGMFVFMDHSFQE